MQTFSVAVTESTWRTLENAGLGGTVRYALRFCRGGLLRFLSNQETATAIERMLRRASLSLRFSAGFHPHPKLSYSAALATSVASAAVYVLIDTEKEENQILEKLKKEGVSTLRILDVWQVEDKTSIGDVIDGYAFRLVLPEESYDICLYSEEKKVIKQTKRGELVFSASEAFQNLTVTVLEKHYMVKYLQRFDSLVSYEELLRLLSKGQNHSTRGVYPFVEDGILGDMRTSTILNRLGGKQDVRSQ